MTFYIRLNRVLPGMPRAIVRLNRRFSAAVGALLGFFRRKAARNPLLTPKPAAPPAAPRATVFPSAIAAGMSAAKGRMPPL